MGNPRWYRSWRHDAVHQLQEKNAQLASKFGLGTWPRYDYDIDAGTLTFSDQGVAKVVAQIQIIGTTSIKAGNWLWAWGNEHWPAERVTDSKIVRAFGEERRITELISDYVTGDNLNALGWELTAVAARVTDALGAYRPPRDDDGGLYLTYESIAWVA
jgi:hypothetical protein